MTKKSFKLIIFLIIFTNTAIGIRIASSETTMAEKIEYYLAKQDWNNLEKIGSPAVPKLIDSLMDEEEHVRYNVAETLGKIGDKRAIEPLLKLIEKDNNRLLYI